MADLRHQSDTLNERLKDQEHGFEQAIMRRREFVLSPPSGTGKEIIDFLIRDLEAAVKIKTAGIEGTKEDIRELRTQLKFINDIRDDCVTATSTTNSK